MKKLDFEEKKAGAMSAVCAQNDMVLATSYNDKVTARTVYCVSDGKSVFFMTSKAYTKYKQIEKNPSVALCFDNMQIEGTAKILGHPVTDANRECISRCVNVTESFLSAAKYKNTVLIEITIDKIEMWVNNGREYIDFVKNESYHVG